MRRFVPLIAGHLLGSLVWICACSARLPSPELIPHPEEAFIQVPFPPPPARAEAVPDQPEDGHVWVDGQWLWRAGRWVWKQGYWSLPPEGAFYSLSRFERRPDGTLRFAPGTWRTTQGLEIQDPEPSARARAREGAVINWRGETETPPPNVKPD